MICTTCGAGGGAKVVGAGVVVTGTVEGGDATAASATEECCAACR